MTVELTRYQKGWITRRQKYGSSGVSEEGMQGMIRAGKMWLNKKRGPMKKETREKLRNLMIGRNCVFSELHKQNLSKAAKRRKVWLGPNHPRWKEDRSLVGCTDTLEYQVWRTTVFERDRYICLEVGPNCMGHLEPHHKKSRDEYPELMYDVDNGQTLCVFHHAEKHPQQRAMMMARVS